MSLTILACMRRLGFRLEQMGGGCTAYVREDGPVYELITTVGDPAHPRRWSSPVAYGVFPLGEGAPIAATEYPSLRACLHAIPADDADEFADCSYRA